MTLEIDICSPLFQLIINSQNMNIKGLGRHRLSDSKDGDEEVALWYYELSAGVNPLPGTAHCYSTDLIPQTSGLSHVSGSDMTSLGLGGHLLPISSKFHPPHHYYANGRRHWKSDSAFSLHFILTRTPPHLPINQWQHNSCFLLTPRCHFCQN